MDALTIFGIATVTAMLVFYALEERSPSWTFWFALTCLASSAYGFLQGAWPIGCVELIWTVVALRRWHGRTRSQDEQALRDRVMRGVTQCVETPSGFVLTLSDAVPTGVVVEWLTLERRACPLVDLALRFDHAGPTTVELSSDPGTKDLLRAELAGLA